MVEEQLSRHGIALPAGQDRQWLETLVGLYQEKMHFAEEFIELSRDFFREEIEWDDEARQIMQDESAQQVIRTYRDLLMSDTEHTADASKARFKTIQQDLGVKGKALFMPVRSAIMGTVHGPDLQLGIACLPKSWILGRIEKALQLVAK